jgi:hypothetical protein
MTRFKLRKIAIVLSSLAVLSGGLGFESAYARGGGGFGGGPSHRPYCGQTHQYGRLQSRHRAVWQLAPRTLPVFLGGALAANPLVEQEAIPISNCLVRAQAQDRVESRPGPLIRFGHSLAEAGSCSDSSVK